MNADSKHNQRSGSVDQTIEKMRQKLHRNPGDTAVRRALAQLLQRVDRLCEAQEHYDRLVTGNPTQDATVWLEAGTLADAIGDDARAIKRLECAVTLADGNESEALEALALAHMHGGRLEVAGRCWWRLTRVGAPAIRAWAGLLVCALARGRSTLATKAERAVSRHASPAQRCAELAKLWPAAAAATVIARHIGSAASAPARPLGLLDSLLSKAAETLDRHATGFPLRADSHYHLARCRQGLGQQQAAEQAVKAALAINPGYIAAAKLDGDLKQAA
jgi:tetratricopeptide (TPR) repeat protein